MDIFGYVIEISKRLEKSDVYFGHGTDNSIDEAAYIICGSLNISYDCDLRLLNYHLSPEDIELIEEKVECRIKENIPAAYLVGESRFAELEFLVDERALIPRSPIAELILNRFATLIVKEPGRILDLCTGNGCIGISIAKKFKDSLVDLLDNDEGCLMLARENIAKHSLFNQTSLIQSNLFEKVTGKYDLIVSNPPYVSSQEYNSLPAEYFHEPKSGLVCAEAGLTIPIKILQEARNYLAEGGLLILEVGHSRLNLEKRFPLVPFLWLDFENGGSGILAITLEQLTEYSKELN
tara:strand:+ start:1013 stop:1891 length:879 start_codon:yes stop_codon:yes gene_type:complete